jgi:NitT/TauT family transport system substrate-binding protein
MTEPFRLSRAQTIKATLGACAAGALFSGLRSTSLAQTPLVVRIGSGNVEPNAQVFYAIDQGFFKKNGIDPQLTIMRSGGVTMEAIVSNQLDCGVGNNVSLGSAILRKIPFVIIAPGIYWDAKFPNAAIVVAPNAPIKSAKDLDGKTIAVTSLGSIDGLGVETYMDQNGGNLSTVKFVELVPSAQAESIARGSVAAGVINDPELSSAEAAGKIRRLVDAYNGVAKLFYGTTWFTTRDWLSKNKDGVKRFADAIVRAGTWAENNRSQALPILEKYTKFHEDKSIARYGPGKVEPKYVQPVWDAAYKYKIYPQPLKAVDYCWDGN